MLEVDKKTFEDEVLKAEGYVFVDFFGDGCVPCQALMPFVHEMADKYGDKIKFTSLNTTKARRLAIGQKILGLPVMAIYKDGEKVEEVVKDDATQESIEAMIQNGASAAQAVKETGDTFAAAFSAMDDAYMQARATDVQDISTRVVTILCNGKVGFSMEEPGILIAEDLTPSETVQMPKDKILAFVTRQGSSNSHTAILARIMGIPSLVKTQINLEEDLDGKMMIVDGFDGCYYIDPDEETLAKMQEKKRTADEYQRQLENYRGKESVTPHGQKIKLYANIGSPADVEHVLKGDAEGVGLLRSEFLYLGRDTYPTEDELFNAYRKVVEGLEGRRVVIRTLDIGADKQVDYFNLGNEDNPALGYRAIRICLTQPDIFKTQLRALLRAAVYGNLSIMYPMITSTEEVKKIYEIVAEVEAELKEQEIQYKLPEQGIMIETPAAAIISDKLAEMVDFFSIGTNDLTQYTLALDRQNAKLDDFYNPHHEAILRMIQMVVDNAHKCGKWAGICGELGADATLTEQFVCMGVDELSVAPSMILKLRKIVREMKKVED